MQCVFRNKSENELCGSYMLSSCECLCKLYSQKNKVPLHYIASQLGPQVTETQRWQIIFAIVRFIH